MDPQPSITQDAADDAADPRPAVSTCAGKEVVNVMFTSMKTPLLLNKTASTGFATYMLRDCTKDELRILMAFACDGAAHCRHECGTVLDNLAWDGADVVEGILKRRTEVSAICKLARPGDLHYVLSCPRFDNAAACM